MKYLKIVPALLLCTLATACNTNRQLFENQEYDQVIQRLAPKVCAGDLKPTDVNMVAASYHNANQADHERIQTLKASGKPEVWPEIYQRYCSMKGRCEALDCFPNRVKQDIHYTKLNLDEDLAFSRSKAEMYLMAKINQLLDSGNKTDVEEAESYIIQLRHTCPENPHIQEYCQKALLRRGEQVLVRFDNDRELPLPMGFATTVTDLGLNGIEVHGTHFTALGNKKSDCSVIVYVVLKNIEITPVRDDEVTFKETLNGETAEVTDHVQSKSVTLTGSIEYYDAEAHKKRFASPFSVKSDFHHEFSTLKGNREACSAETLQKLEEKPVPVPTDESMLLDAAAELNRQLVNELTK